MKTLNTYVDRPLNLNNKVMDKMVAEISPFLNEFEIDKIVEFMWTIDTSKFEVNYTIDDASSQLKIILGAERYEQVKGAWASKNQHLIKQTDANTVKYRRRSDGLLFDGLDPEDNPADYQQIIM